MTDVILAWRVWSSPDITFKVLPFQPNMTPSLILCIGGLTSPDIEAAKIAVRTAWSQPKNEMCLVDLVRTNDAAFKGAGRNVTRAAIAEMINSVSVDFVDIKEARGIPSPCFNIFITSPMECMVTWTHLKALLFSLSYPTLLTGTGHPKSLFSCQICHSFGHPRGLCPFPLIPGWNGLKCKMMQNGAGRGRGYGRGRGFRGGPLY